MAFKTDRQRKAVMARLKEKQLPRFLLDPSGIPKGTKFIVTKTTGLGAFTSDVVYFKDRKRAEAFAIKNKRDLVRVPKKVIVPAHKIFTKPSQKTKTIVIRRDNDRSDSGASKRKGESETAFLKRLELGRK